MAQYNGTSGDLTAAGEALQVTKWSASAKAESLKSTDKASLGFQELIAGIQSCELSAEAFFDSAVNDGDPPEVHQGQTIAFLGYRYTGDPTPLTGNFLVTEYSYDCPVDGIISYSIKAESTGRFYVPGEAST